MSRQVMIIQRFTCVENLEKVRNLDPFDFQRNFLPYLPRIASNTI